MGTVFGKVGVETAKFEVLQSTKDYEIRKYIPAVAAEVTYDPSQFKGDKDGGFDLLAKYIGAFGKPENTRPEPIAMTAPVITKSSTSEPIAITAPVLSKSTTSEPIAMTAPVITKSSTSEPIAMTAPVLTKSTTSEPIAMTAPVVTKEGEGKLVTMQFLLPGKYRKAEDAPKPLDERVVIKEVGERKYGVVVFSGVATEKVVAEKVEKLKVALERDGIKVVGEFVLGRYNPPWTLPIFRTNEVMIPIE